MEQVQRHQIRLGIFPPPVFNHCSVHQAVLSTHVRHGYFKCTPATVVARPVQGLCNLVLVLAHNTVQVCQGQLPAEHLDITIGVGAPGFPAFHVDGVARLLQHGRSYMLRIPLHRVIAEGVGF